MNLTLRTVDLGPSNISWGRTAQTKCAGSHAQVCAAAVLSPASVRAYLESMT